MSNYDMADVQKQWYDRNGWPLDLNAVYAINEFKGDSSDMAAVQKWYLDGGPGSGNWGHQGRPGIRGGSSSGGGVAYRLNTPSGGYTGLVGAYKENEARNKNRKSQVDPGKGKEPEKTKEPEKQKSTFTQALENGTWTSNDFDNAETGDVIDYKGGTFVKIGDDAWVDVTNGFTMTQSGLKGWAQREETRAEASSFSKSDLAPTKITKDELDGAIKDPSDVDDIQSAVSGKIYGSPVGATYEDKDGHVYIKTHLGTWAYSEDLNHKQSAEDAAFNIANDYASRNGIEEKSRLRYNAERIDLEYKEPKKLDSPKPESEIIDKLSGPDLTKGSCASLAFAYAGQKAGIDVTDYRGGDSQDFFSRTRLLMSAMKNVGAKTASAKSDFASARQLLKDMPERKEHILMAGHHAAVVKKENGKLFYLEMQGMSFQNGWQQFNKTTLAARFDCKRSHSRKYVGSYEVPSLLVDVESLGKSKEFQKTLGYINTAVGEQKKGAGGYAK